MLEIMTPPKTLEQRLLEAMLQGLSARPGWEAFLEPADPVEWMQQHFYIPETPNHRLELQPYQQDCIREILTPGPDGLFRYSTVILSDVKKSIKSTLAAAITLYRAWRTPWGQFTLVANDLKGADSRVGFYIRRAIELNAEMSAVCKVINYKVTLPNRAFIESIPIDPSGEAGGNADMVVFSELWGAHQQAQKRMWTEATIPPAKHGKAFRLIETYAGFSGESVLLEQLYETGVKQGKQFEWAKKYDPPLEAYYNSAARMFCLWNTTPRCPWQTPAYYASEAAILEDSEFQRVHRNQWASATAQFVSLAWWEACKVEETPDFEENTEVVIGVDAAIEGDCFGVVAISGDGEGHYYVRYARAWYPPKGSHVHFRTPDKDGPEDEIVRLTNEWNVIDIVYDPYQMADLAERFTSNLIANMTAFGQSSPRLIADKKLLDSIRERKIHHSGEADLKEHISNANKKTEGESKLRIIKRANHLKIDLAVALSMALDTIKSWNL